jgi:hypothetical protein
LNGFSLVVATYLQGLESNGRDGFQPPKNIFYVIFYLMGERDQEKVGFMIQDGRELEEKLSFSFVSMRACLVGISAIRDS